MARRPNLIVERKYGFGAAGRAEDYVNGDNGVNLFETAYDEISEWHLKLCPLFANVLAMMATRLLARFAV